MWCEQPTMTGAQTKRAVVACVTLALGMCALLGCDDRPTKRQETVRVDGDAVRGDAAARRGDSPKGEIQPASAAAPSQPPWWFGVLALGVPVGLVFLGEWLAMPPWPKLNIGGAPRHVIPAVCPNCLAQADVEFRYGHRGWFMTLIAPFNASYQSFFYCRRCADSVRAHLKFRGIMYVLLYILTGAFTSLWLFGVPALLLAGLLTRIVPQTPVGIGFIIAAGVGFFVFEFWLFARVLKGWLRRRHPQQPDQAVWGLAALYTGYGQYCAARPEWLLALADANGVALSEVVRTGLLCQQPPVVAAQPGAIP